MVNIFDDTQSALELSSEAVGKIFQRHSLLSVNVYFRMTYKPPAGWGIVQNHVKKREATSGPAIIPQKRFDYFDVALNPARKDLLLPPIPRSFPISK